MIVGKSLFTPQAGFGSIQRMQQRLDDLQVQMGTGQKSQTLAGLGSDRLFDLTVRARLSRIDGYKQSADTAQLRLGVYETTLKRMDALESETRSSATLGGFGANDLNLNTVPTLSRARLDETISLLNNNVGGRYLFGGNVTDKPPVAGIDEILDGANGRDGFRTIVSQRNAADLGDDGLGRLDLGVATDTVSLAEDGTHPFGFKLSTLSASGAGLTLTSPTGAPPALAIKVTAAPAAGDTITIGLTLPDGTASSVTLKAITGTPANTGEFQIGTTNDATAANIGAALQGSLTDAGTKQLQVASTFAAADNFFNGQGQQVMRVDGPPYDTATGLVAATSTDTVQWYRGEDSANARDTVKVKVDDSTVVSYGAQANEDGFVQMMRSLAVMTVETYPQGDATAKARFNAVAQTQGQRLAESNNGNTGSVESVMLELELASGTISNTMERHDAYKVQLDTTLADTEQVSVEDVAMELLNLKTRLEASYSTMSMVNQLSLVNYLR